jgi:CheY-like chemotaxis protein
VQSQAVSLAAKGVVLATSSPLRSIVVLIVEDEFLVRLDIAAYLRDCGFTVFEADTADEAITLCRTGVAPDVLLTDINLNGSANGWDVAEEFVRYGRALASCTHQVILWTVRGGFLTACFSTSRISCPTSQTLVGT